MSPRDDAENSSDGAGSDAADAQPGAGSDAADAQPDLRISAGRPFREGKRHWWALFVVALIVAVATVYGELKPEPPPATAPIVNNWITAEGEPPERTGCDVGDEYRAGWGPPRPMKAAAGPYAFDYPTLNSYTESPTYGDARQFARVKNAANQDAGGWSDEVINPELGERFYLQAIVVNSSYVNEVLTAKEVRAWFTVPNCRSKQIGIRAIVKSSNTFPESVWSGVNFYSGDEFALAYVPGSAHLYNNQHPDGLQIEGTKFLESEGQPLGFDKLDGIMPAGMQYEAYFVITVEVV